jgi:tyrosine-protein kinase Etk/Wzc
MATEVLNSELQQNSGVAPSEDPLVDEGKAKDDEVSLFDVLVVLVERRRTIAWITGACAVLAVIASLLQPKKYTATVTLLPPHENSSMSASLGSQLSSLGGAAALASSSLGLKNPNEMFVAMLKSRTVEDAMVAHFGLLQQYDAHYLSDARKAFERDVTVDGNGKDGLIHISVEARDPQRAADLANGYVDQFRVLSQHLAITEAGQRRLFFERQLGQTKDDLAKAEEAFKETEQRTGLIQLDSQARALIESAASLRAQIAAKEVQIQSMETYATDENPQLVKAQRELSSLREQLAKLGGSEDSSSGGLIVPKGKVPAAGMEYVRGFREVKYQETIFEILARQFEMAKLDEAKQGALIQVVDSAIPPDKRSSPKRAVIVICATVMGAVFAVFFVLLQAGFERMKTNTQFQERFAILKRAFKRHRTTARMHV